MSDALHELRRAFDDGRGRAELYRMWRMGLHAGFAHPRSLGAIGPLRGAAAALHAHLRAGTAAGRSLAALAAERPVLFEPFEAALLTMGEESGRLEPVLTELGAFFERQHRMMLALRKHLAYPMFVSLMAAVLLPLPLLAAGRTGAWAGATVLGLATWASAGIAAFARRAQAYQRRPAFVRARLARTLALTVGAGLPLDRALSLAAEASGAPALVAHVRALGLRRIATQPLSASLAGAPDLPPEFHAMLRVAEETGDVDATLAWLAALYEDGFR